MIQLVFLLEEESAKAMLEGFLPRILPDTPCRCVPFEGKSDLERQLVRRLRGWRAPDTRFVVLRDMDRADCVAVKKELQAKCREAGKPDTLVRVACHELESWYLADLNAVEVGLEIAGLARHQQKAKYRKPDALANASDELRKLTGGRYQKVSGSRVIGPCLDPENSRSVSFVHFVRGLREIVDGRR